MPRIPKPKVPSTGTVAPKLSEQPELPKYDHMAAAALALSAPGKHFEKLAIQKRMMEGSFDLYQSIQQRDALDSILAMLATSLTSASLDCFAQAANLPPGQAKLRDLNLRHGIKGAAAAAELVKALDNRRREKSEEVTSGQVTVEAGGQAIVGNVEAASHAGGGSPTKPSKTE